MSWEEILRKSWNKRDDEIMELGDEPDVPFYGFNSEFENEFVTGAFGSPKFIKDLEELKEKEPEMKKKLIVYFKQEEPELLKEHGEQYLIDYVFGEVEGGLYLNWWKGRLG